MLCNNSWKINYCSSKYHSVITYTTINEILTFKDQIHTINSSMNKAQITQPLQTLNQMMTGDDETVFYKFYNSQQSRYRAAQYVPRVVPPTEPWQIIARNFQICQSPNYSYYSEPPAPQPMPTYRPNQANNTTIFIVQLAETFNAITIDFAVLIQNVATHVSVYVISAQGERGDSVVECQTLEREVWGSKLSPPCCVLEQDTLLPGSTGNTQEAVAPSRHDWKIVDWDIKPQHNKTNYSSVQWCACQQNRPNDYQTQPVSAP